jgi:single-stranded-DNA-specific exonuclease
MKNLNKNQVIQSKNQTLYYKSVKGTYWSEKDLDLDNIESLVDQFDLEYLNAKILTGRGINIKNFNNFFNSKIKNNLPNPSNLLDLDMSTELIVEFILNKKKIGILGDYDVDGATSTTLLCSYLKKVNASYEYYIPDRVKEGYGPNKVAFQKLMEKGCKLVLTVDCGTTANISIEEATKNGMKIIVVDHHQQGGKLPKNCLIINPNRNKDMSNLNHLAAVGVSFLLLVSIHRKLKEKKIFQKIPEPNLLSFLDLVALGTICDVVKLDNLNRTFVKQGLKVINKTKNFGLRSLIESSGIQNEIDEYHLGYILGPKINAGGRIGDSSKGVELLLSENTGHTLLIADELTKLNIERQKIEKNVENLAITKIVKDDNIICVNGEGWHPGVIGIVAGRLTERFLKPSIVISESSEICKGSARSIPGYNIGELINKAFEDGILENGGGHKMAGGLSIKKEKISLFKSFLKDKSSVLELQNKKYYDHEITLSLINKSLFNLVNNISPFGSGNPKPKFLIKKCFVKYPKLVGNNHLSFYLSDIYGNSVKAISFKAFDNSIGNLVMGSQGKVLDLIGQVNMNYWNGSETLQLQIEDVCEELVN